MNLSLDPEDECNWTAVMDVDHLARPASWHREVNGVNSGVADALTILNGDDVSESGPELMHIEMDGHVLTIENPSEVQTLSFTGKSITELPISIPLQLFSSIRSLDLSWNKLCEIPEQIVTLIA